MKKTMTLALFVFAASLANASLNYSDPGPDLTVDLPETVLDQGDSFDITTPSVLPQPDSIEFADATIVKFISAEDPLAPDAPPLTAWLELFHER
jgi:hypothetical protein